MPVTETIEVLIVVRTYPTPSKKHAEVSCTAGITRDGRWVRLFPIPYRSLDQDVQFHKYQWIRARVHKATDHRIESYHVDCDSIERITDELPTTDAWRARKDIVFPLKAHCLCCLKRSRDQTGKPTLGIFRPRTIERLVIEPDRKDWTPDELASLRRDQAGLFGAPPPVAELEKVPFKFKYVFKCDESSCGGHALSCTDWEIGQSWRKWHRECGDRWEDAIRATYEAGMIRLDTHFVVGTLMRHPAEWNVVGLFYPPKTSGDLFGPN